MRFKATPRRAGLTSKQRGGFRFGRFGRVSDQGTPSFAGSAGLTSNRRSGLGFLSPTHRRASDRVASAAVGHTTCWPSMPGDGGSVSSSTPTSGTLSASWLTFEDTASGSSRRTRASGQPIRTVGDTSRSTGERSNGPGNSGDEGKCSAVPEHLGTGTSSAPQGLSERPTAVPQGDPTPRYNLRPRAKKSQQATSMPQNKTTSVLLQEKWNVPAAGVSRLKGEHVASGSTSGHKRKRLSSRSSHSAVSESSGSSAKKKCKLSKGVGNSGDEHQGTPTHSAPQGRSKGPATVQRSEPLGDCSPRYNFRHNRPTANKPQEARSCKPERRATSTHLQEKQNVPAAANSEQRLKQMANSSGRAGKRKRVQSQSSSSVCSRDEKRPKPHPPTSRDPRTTTGPKESPKPLSRAEKRALAEQAVCRANYKRFMKEVYPELVKAKSPWAWSGTSTTPDSPKSSQRSHAPGKRPLSETAEAKLGRPSARPEGAPVGKRSFWYVPKALKSQDYKTDKKPRETRRYRYRTSDPSSVHDSPIGTVKPTYNFWQSSGRSWKKSARPATGPELLMERDGEEEIEAAVNSLKAAAAQAAETNSPKAPSPRVSRLLERHGKEPPMPPKGVKRKAKDAFAQTDFTCMVGKNIKLDGAARKRLRETLPVREEQVQFRDMPMEEAGGGAGIAFGNYFSTGTTAMGVMRLGPNSEKPTSVNNEHDMFVYALDNGVKITTLGGTWMILPKGSTFFICRGMPFTLQNLSLKTAKVLYALTDPCEADSEA